MAYRDALTLPEGSSTLPDPSLTGTASAPLAAQETAPKKVDNGGRKEYYTRLDATAVAADAMLIDK